MSELKDFTAVKISLASPEKIREWSHGEVTKPETINYRTQKPERDGLFCERIFGPEKDYECACGKYKKMRHKEVVCEKCGVEVTRSKVRRERMGHIELAAPVAHIWFVKVPPSRIGLLLDLSIRNLEQVLYFAKYIITRVDEDKKREKKKELEDERALLEEELKELGEGEEGERARIEEKIEEIRSLEDELEDIREKKLLSINEYKELKERWGDIFEADMGAEAILDILKRLDLNKMRAELLEEIASGSEQRKKKAMKALRVVEAFRRSGNKPEWMILRVLPVLPPDLRPMVQLEGGRFASSDLNDLYRRVINRNNRLKKLLEMEAPDIIIKNEKRMLQEAVDALIDNGRKARPLMNSQGNRLKSLSDLLRGKQGRFRQNLLGKRVDYSGRSVIVVGPELKLHECGLPKKMALELFKPFVIRRLIARGLAHSIRSAKRMVERARPEVWEILEEVVRDHPVLLNRAPTLHRLSIQAFMPRLIDSEAIQLHPLVCPAFNADFDGDQMAVHVPLSKAAIYEAKEYILSTKNMLLPSSGEPIVAPTLDIVFGCYWLSLVRKGVKGEGRLFSSFDEVKLAHEFGEVDLHALVKVKAPWGEKIETTPGRIILNEALPEELRFVNDVVDKKKLKNLVAESYRLLGNERTAEMLDRIKELGYHYATLSGMSMSINDLEIPPEKKEYIEEAERELSKIERQYERGLITDEERYRRTVDLWDRVVKELTRKLEEKLDPFSSIAMMANSGAKGNITQIRQMACMRGLMSDPSGKIIDMPIRSSLKEGLPVLEYFISTHGARKGLADTALRTSDSGYLTRRLIDVAHEVLVREEDCGTDEGIWIEEKKDALLPPFEERILGRIAQQDVVHDGEVIVRRGEEIDEEKAQRIKELGISRVYVRSPLTCRTHGGVCRLCYGRDIARRGLIRLREAVGIIAAQSIGEPGTQLTMRTFHTGGVAGYDITLGLPRVEELFEARVPKGQGYISDIDGVVKIENTEEGRRIRVISTHTYVDGYPIPEGYRIVVEDGKRVDAGDVLAVPEDGEKKPIKAKVSGTCEVEENRVYIRYDEKVERDYLVPFTTYILVRDGQEVRAGDQLTEGPLNPHDILRIKGKEAVQRYLIDEIQKVYRSQGVSIHDKHIEVIIRQMMKCVRIDSPGDTEFLAGDLVERWEYEETNARVLASGGEPATAHPVLLGITRAALTTSSFLSAASFQETTRVLTDAAIRGAVDRLFGLKENVIIGKLIPARVDIKLEDDGDKEDIQPEGGGGEDI